MEAVDIVEQRGVPFLPLTIVDVVDSSWTCCNNAPFTFMAAGMEWFKFKLRAVIDDDDIPGSARFRWNLNAEAAVAARERPSAVRIGK